MSSSAVRTRTPVLVIVLLALLGSLLVGGRTATAAPTLGERAVAEAQRHAGKPYRWGAMGPDRFDCSGFTLYVFKRLGRSLPHNSRMQYDAVPKVPNHHKRVGDLIFTRRSNGSIGHVGIYAGGAHMWAAVKSGDVVRKQSFHGRSYSVGRVR